MGDAHPAVWLRVRVKLPKLIEFPPDAIVTYSIAAVRPPVVLPNAKRPRVELEQPPTPTDATDRSPNPPYEPVEAMEILEIVVCLIVEGLTPPAKTPIVLDEHAPYCVTLGEGDPKNVAFPVVGIVM